jgi:hypothetical protein
MITDTMMLNTVEDAKLWASVLGLVHQEQDDRVAKWIWENKPAIGCFYDDHPISTISDEEFWSIADGVELPPNLAEF